MNYSDIYIKDVKVIHPKIYKDDRGFFLESYNYLKYKDVLNFNNNFVQDNHSKSSHGVLRGLHFQKNNPQGKLVRVIAGSVFDVIVDLRKKSKTFGKWFGIDLSADNKTQLWVPPGFAHGFYTTSSFAEFEYKCTSFYEPSDEYCLTWDDDDVKIKWPIINNKVSISPKDKEGLSLNQLISMDII